MLDRLEASTWVRPRLVNLTSADSSDGGPVNDKSEFMSFNDSLAPS